MKAEIKAREDAIQEALRRFYNRTSFELSDDKTPLDALLAAEEGELDEWAVKRETGVRLLEWIAADGPHPAQLLRRLLLLGHHMMVSPYCELNLREKAVLTGDSHGAIHWLMKRLVLDPLQRKGWNNRKASGQKGAGASAAAAAAQKGNTNRRDGARKKISEPKRPGNDDVVVGGRKSPKNKTTR